MSKLELDIKELEQAKILLEAANKNIHKVLSRALNRTAQMAKTKQNRMIRQGYNIPAQIVRTRIVLKNSKPKNLETVVLNSSKRVALENFKINKNNPGHYKDKMRVSVKKGSFKTLNGGFWAFYKTKPNNLGLYNRSGIGRDTLEKLYGPSAYQMGTNEKIQKSLEDESIETFKERFRHEFMRELKR
ncbi:MAG: phage tail protein [Cetobacterium sp.]